MLRVFLERSAHRMEVSGWGGWLLFIPGGLLDPVRNGLAQRIEERRERSREAGTPLGSARARDNRRGGGMDSLVKDTKYAVRTLLKNPGFAVVAIVTIALGIGANTAIFSVVQTVLLDPLPYEEPEELVILWGEMRTRGVTHFPTSPPDFQDFRDQADLLEDLGGVFSFNISITGDGEPVQVSAGSVTTNFFDMLGVEPMLGRSFVDEDGIPNDPNVGPAGPGALPGMVILSHALWQQRYGGDREVIGTTIQLGGVAAEIVGVMPLGFELLMPATASLAPEIDLWMAARLDFANAPRNNVFLRPVGRLRDGASPQQLQAQIDRIAASLAADDQVKTTAGYAVRVEEMKADITAEVRPVLLALFGAVVFVLLIACANVSNLLLVRASGRDRELAVRAALGGSRGRLMRQMLIESGLLAFAGAVVGLALATGGIQLLLALQPGDLPRVDSVGIDLTVLGFTFVAAVVAALIFGVLPALQASRVELVDALKERGQAGGSAGRRLVRDGVIVGEVALSLVLLIGAGLMVRSFVALNNVEPGYDPESVLTFSATPPFGSFPTVEDRVAFGLELQRRLEALPGVERAASGFPLPLTGNLFNGRYGPEEALTDPEAFSQAAYRGVTPGYFEAMGTRVLSGRTFSDADVADSATVVVVDEIIAENLWPDESAIGQRFLVRATSPEPQWVEVIGVVEHQRAETLAADGMEAVFFHSRYLGGFGGQWVMRVGADPLGLISSIRTELDAIDPDVPLADVRLMESIVGEAMGPTRFALTLIGVFGIIALILASIGLYGVLSYVVKQRTAEIGVRMAFGAETGSILKLVVGQGLALAGAGVALGLVIAFPLTSFMETLLVGVRPTDPVTFVGISAIFVAVAALACYVPARRATLVDPVTALREE